MRDVKKIVLFGGTGSIGSQTLDIIRKQNYQLIAFTFNNNIDKAKNIIEEFNPQIIGVTSNKYNEELTKVKKDLIIEDDFSNIINNTKDIENIIYINALTGSSGLKVTYDIINNNHNILLANKESLVMAGPIITNLAKNKNVKIIPIDSEHSALLKLTDKENKKEIKKLYISASGGALRDVALDELDNATCEDALKHPNWLMGKDITINCATMVNKGYEVIEAAYLFNIDIDKIEVLIHRESIVHALIEFNDSTIHANMSTSDMRIPILYAIEYPNIENYHSNLDLAKISCLHFANLDEKRYPAFKLCLDAYKLGKYYPTILNASNEEAVHLFEDGKIKFGDIYRIIKKYLALHDSFLITKEEFTIENIVKLDKIVKNLVKNERGENSDFNNN